MSNATPSLEDVAIKVVTKFGTSAGYEQIWWTLSDHGMMDPEGELADRIFEMVKTATVRVKVQFF